jgi:hypothetical protein
MGARLTRVKRMIEVAGTKLSRLIMSPFVRVIRKDVK